MWNEPSQKRLSKVRAISSHKARYAGLFVKLAAKLEAVRQLKKKLFFLDYPKSSFRLKTIH